MRIQKDIICELDDFSYEELSNEEYQEQFEKWFFKIFWID